MDDVSPIDDPNKVASLGLTIHYKNVRVISTLPGLAQLHLFSDLQYIIL